MSNKGKIAVKYLKTGDIREAERNARSHSKEQVAQVEKSITDFGFTNPILIDENGVIIAGHGRLGAAKNLAMAEVPTITLTGLTDAQKRAYAIADNKLALNASWDLEVLKIEIEELSVEGIDPIDTGWEIEELAELGIDIDTGADVGNDKADATPAPEAVAVSKTGDVWILGKHRLICGDSTDIDVIARALEGDKPDVVIADPPYGISYKIGKSKSVKGRKDWDKIHGDDNTDAACALFANCTELAQDARQIWWGANYYPQVLDDGYGWVVWDKGISPDFMLSSCEIAYCNKGHKTWLYKHTWSGCCKASEMGTETLHSNQKPVALIDWCFENLCDMTPQSIVLDPCSGSGTVLIACESKGYACVSIEIDPKFVDVAISRWQDYTGEKAVLEGDGRTFDEIKIDVNKLK